MAKKLSGEDFRADVGHLHFLWMYTSIAASKWSRVHDAPLLITPNGMLERWALNNSKVKKKIAYALFERKNLKSAACIQANTVKEVEDLRLLGLANSLCVIPNGVEIPPDSFFSEQQGAPRDDKEVVRLVFLGRIHPKKGLLHLISGLDLWKRRERRNGIELQLVIAGFSEVNHLEELEKLASALNSSYKHVEEDSWGVDSSAYEVLFHGPVYREEKARLLNTADLFVLPSLSEGQPMAILDAMAHRLPVMMTRECNLDDVFDKAGGIEIKPNAKSISEGIQTFVEMSIDDRAKIGDWGLSLVRANYSWESIAKQLEEVYFWMAGNGPRPDSLSGI